LNRPFKKGDVVLCINPQIGLKKNSIYVVYALVDIGVKEWFVELEGIFHDYNNAHTNPPCHRRFFSSRFKKLGKDNSKAAELAKLLYSNENS
jgi:hypothetical protein